jgi:hypothetical protein
MKKLPFLLLSVMFLVGCVSIRSPEMLNKSFPADGKYEILGEVGAGDIRFIVFGIFWKGGVGWLDLRREAIKKFGDFDDVVSVSVDTETNSVLGLFIWQRIIIRGIAIRYIKDPGTP